MAWWNAAAFAAGTYVCGCVILASAGLSAAEAQSSTVTLDQIEVEASRNVRRQSGDNQQAESTQQQQSGNAATQGYVATRSATGTKTDTPILETPQSISVVTRKQMDDQNVQSLNEALEYTPGVTTSMYGYDPRYNAFRIRGFDAMYTGVFRDGLRELNGNLSVFNTEPYGLDSITILRGPSSALYSQSSPGGLVDLQSKRPTVTPLREVEAQYGTDRRWQGNFDFSGPVDQDRTFLYRLTGLFRDKETSRLWLKDERAFIAPAFTYKPSQDTTFTVLSEYQWKKYPGTNSFYNDANGITNIPFGDPYYNDSIQQQGRIGYAFEHRFSDAVKVRQNFRWSKIDVDYKYAGISSIVDKIASRYHERYLEDVDSVVVDNQVEVKFATGPVHHTVLAGMDYAYADYRRGWGTGSSPPLNLTTLNYGTGTFIDPAINQFTGIKQNQLGVYIQDQARFGDFIATLNGRHDWLDRNYYWQVPDTSLDGNRKDEKFSGRAGLTYVSPSGLAPYVSYSTSFSPMLVTAPINSGAPFAPTTAQGGEVGIKYQPPGVNALFTMALFDITQQNVIVYNAVAGNHQQIGEVHSRGFEFEAVASLGSGFSMTTAYTYLDMDITKGLPSEVGHMPSGVPHHQLSVWGDYKESSGPFAGFGVGLGARYVGTSYGNNSNTFTNEAATIFDGKLSYDLGARNPQFKGWQLQVNSRNLLGHVYTTCEQGFCYRTEDRSVIASLRYRW